MVPFEFSRSERIISGDINKTSLVAGESFSLDFNIDANLGGTVRDIILEVTLPSNSSIVIDTHQGQIIANKMRWQINQPINAVKETVSATFSTDINLPTSNSSITYSYSEENMTASYVLTILAIEALPIEEPIMTNTPRETSSSGGSVSIVFLFILLFSRITMINRVNLRK